MTLLGAQNIGATVYHNIFNIDDLEYASKLSMARICPSFCLRHAVPYEAGFILHSGDPSRFEGLGVFFFGGGCLFG